MTQLGSSSLRIGLARYHRDGTRDATFGAGGLAFGPGNVWNAGFAIALQPDGKIVVAGSEGEWSAILALYRFNSDGSLDPTFTPPDPLSAPGAASLALQTDGKIVVSTRFYDAYDVSGARARAVGGISLARYHTTDHWIPRLRPEGMCSGADRMRWPSRLMAESLPLPVPLSSFVTTTRR
jgi:uncharacterized delta-60 repeat protein